MSVPYLVLSLHWLNPRTLATVDTLEQVHLIDVRSQVELEVVDVSNAGLVYGSSHFKGLSTGGNVSKALVSKFAFFKCHSYLFTNTYNILVYCSNHIFLFLGSCG